MGHKFQVKLLPGCPITIHVYDSIRKALKSREEYKVYFKGDPKVIEKAIKIRIWSTVKRKSQRPHLEPSYAGILYPSNLLANEQNDIGTGEQDITFIMSKDGVPVVVLGDNLLYYSELSRIYKLLVCDSGGRPTMSHRSRYGLETSYQLLVKLHNEIDDMDFTSVGHDGNLLYLFTRGESGVNSINLRF